MSPESRTVPFPARWLLFGCLTVTVSMALPSQAQDVRLSLPKRTHPTPVQKLNQDGVKAVEKHQYEKAKKLFYKAYLIDPNDPFTLNNLGYIAELDGDIDRAQRFYTLAAEQPSEAAIDTASDPDLLGKEVADIAGNATDRKMEINRTNIYAMNLLIKERAAEADLALQKALALDPKNPFTLNNLGFAKEKEGELEEAVKYYARAASVRSNDPVVVTLNKKWRGRPISEIAADNQKAVQKVLERGEDTESVVARLNLRGVSAINRNDSRLARQYFEQAFKIDPNNSFTLNNMGYLAEIDGDRETAQYLYAKAREAESSESRVALATRREVEGQRMGAVAEINDQTVSDAQQRDLEVRRQQGGPVVLLKRDNSMVAEPDQPVHPVNREAEQVLIPREKGRVVAAPAPANGSQPNQPATTTQPVLEPEQNVVPPLPDNQQPPNADKNEQQQQQPPQRR